MKEVTIYTDGACAGNPGPGGWGAILAYREQEKEIAGFEADTTNNRMELMAALAALRALKEPCRVTLYSDSAYLVCAFNEHWLPNWQRNGWRNSEKKPVANVDLWQALLEQASRHQITWVKVKGHSDNEKNNRCDEMARAEIQNHLHQ